MASPDQYRARSEFRASSARGPVTIDNATGREVPIAPIREASPEEDDAPPVAGMVSRSGDSAWLPASWLDEIATNDDPILMRSGEGLKIYDALLSDDTAFSTLQQRRLAITSREYEVIPGDDKDPRSVKAADDFRAMIDALGFDRVTGFLHYGVWYGYAVGECIWTVRDHDGRPIVWLDDIVVPDRRHFGFTGNGELRFIANGLTEAEGRVPDNKFMTIRTGGTHDFAFYGLGLAHWCYWPIFFKRAALKFWALYLEKRGNPTVAIEFTEAEKDDKAKKASLLAAAVAVGKDSAVLLPDGTLKNERLKIIESQRNGHSTDFKDFADEQNEAIMRVVLGQPGTSKATPGGLGGDGQAKKDEGVKAELVKADSDLITDAVARTAGKWVTRWNHGPDVAPPIVRRILDDSEDLSSIAKRDVDLDGIGIKRTEDSVKATYGDGYVLERETPEEKAQRERDLIAAKAGVVPGAPAADDDVPAKGGEFLAFTAADEDAIDRLITALATEANPVFEAMAGPLRQSLQGVDTVEAARVALLGAFEQLPIDELARLTALPMLAERAGALIGADEEVMA